MYTPNYSLQILAVLMILSLPYPVTAQQTDSTENDFKFCMSTCISNSCSGPASVVEKNCTRKCLITLKTASYIAPNRRVMCIAQQQIPSN